MLSIFAVNRGQDEHRFWCFLAPPRELGPDLSHALSGLSLSVMPNSRGLNPFTIPRSYCIGAGVGPDPVSVGTQITSLALQEAAPGDTFKIEYPDAPPDVKPSITSVREGEDGTRVTVVTEAFEKAQREEDGWFSNQSYGIATARGLMGAVWSPEPSSTISLTPECRFHVVIGEFDECRLTTWDAVVRRAAEVTKDDLRSGKATVTLGSDGAWDVRPGSPD